MSEEKEIWSYTADEIDYLTMLTDPVQWAQNHGLAELEGGEL